LPNSDDKRAQSFSHQARIHGVRASLGGTCGIITRFVISLPFELLPPNLHTRSSVCSQSMYRGIRLTYRCDHRFSLKLNRDIRKRWVSTSTRVVKGKAKLLSWRYSPRISCFYGHARISEASVITIIVPVMWPAWHVLLARIIRLILND